MLGYLVFTCTKLATHLSKVAVAASHRKRGVATLLVQVLFLLHSNFATRV